MDKTWDLVKTVAGAFIIVYAIQGGFEMAKQLGKKELMKELNSKPNLKNGAPGDPVCVEFGGKKFYLKFEEVDS